MRLLVLLSLAACRRDDDTTTDPTVPVGVTVERTAHGVAHVTADDPYGLGYGVGYAYTEDNACLLSYRIAEVTGTLAAHLGADAPVLLAVHDIEYPAIESDRFYRGWYDDAAIEAGIEAGSAEVRDLARGYADGVNRFVAAHGGLSCAVPFPATVTPQMVHKMWVATAGVASGELLASFVANDAPDARRSAPSARRLPATPFGSNAWALGRDATADGGSVHLYNPHFPWTGIHRVWVVHLTIPGDIDVMGPTLGGLPVPVAGFTNDIAWGLTFSNAARFTMDELTLAAGDPRTYLVDGVEHAIEEEVLSIEVQGEGARDVSIFRAEGRPIIHAPLFLMPWNDEHAYAAHDVNADNTRFVEQFFEVARATNVTEVATSLGAVLGVPWSYTTASDRAGDVFFGELSNIPSVSDEQIGACSNSPAANTLRAFGILVLDGSRAECAWDDALPAGALPSTIRTDYVANSNNGYDLPRVGAPLLGLPAVLGGEERPLDLRPILGLRMIEERLAGADGLAGTGFDGPTAEAVFHGERNLAGEILAADIAADCLADPTSSSGADLTAVCTALAGWDHANRVDSVGALVFSGLWLQMNAIGDAASMFATPASWADPLGTPAGYSADPDVRAAVRDALATVADALAVAGLSADSPLGDGHAVIGPDGALPMPGGYGGVGLFDVATGSDGYGTYTGWLKELDGTPAEELVGASWEHVVVLNADGPHARGLLAYSQATEEGSPWYHDQLDEWSASTWFDLPFTPAEVAADPERTTTQL